MPERLLNPDELTGWMGVSLNRGHPPYARAWDARVGYRGENPTAVCVRGNGQNVDSQEDKGRKRSGVGVAPRSPG